MAQIATPYVEARAKVRSEPTNERTIQFGHPNEAPPEGNKRLCESGDGEDGDPCCSRSGALEQLVAAPKALTQEGAENEMAEPIPFEMADQAEALGVFAAMVARAVLRRHRRCSLTGRQSAFPTAYIGETPTFRTRPIDTARVF